MRQQDFAYVDFDSVDSASRVFENRELLQVMGSPDLQVTYSNNEPVKVKRAPPVSVTTL